MDKAREFINLGAEIGGRMDKLRPQGRPSQALGWAAFNLGAALTGGTMIKHLQTVQGLESEDDDRDRYDVGHHRIFEAEFQEISEHDINVVLNELSLIVIFCWRVRPVHRRRGRRDW